MERLADDATLEQVRREWQRLLDESLTLHARGQEMLQEAERLLASPEADHARYRQLHQAYMQLHTEHMRVHQAFMWVDGMLRRLEQ